MLDSIKAKTKELNRLRDEIANSISVVQDTLRDEGVGITIWCVINDKIKVGWSRWHGKFRFVVHKDSQEHALDELGSEFKRKFAEKYMEPLLTHINMALATKIIETKKVLNQGKDTCDA